MQDRKVEKRIFEECPHNLGCFAEYDLETGKPVRVIACMAANYKNKPVGPEDVEVGERLSKTCPIGGQTPPVDLLTT